MRSYFKAIMENFTIGFSVEKDIIVDINFMDDIDLLQFIEAPVYQFFNYLDENYSEYTIQKVDYISDESEIDFEQD